METIKLENSDRFDAAFFSEPLTAYAQNFMTAGGRTQEILDFFAGKVYVPRRFEFRKYSSEAELATQTYPFLSRNADVVRALGSDFKIIEGARTVQLSKTYNKGLAVRLDEDEISSDPQWEVNVTKQILCTLQRTDAYTGGQLLYASVPSVATAPTWNGSAGQDPDGDLMAMLDECESATNVRPNYILFPSGLWAARIKTLRAQTSLLAVQSANQSVEQLSDWLQCKVVVCSKMDFPIENVILAGVTGTGGLDDISTVRRFVTTADGGVDYRAFKRQISSKVWEIVVEHYSNIVATAPTLGIYMIPDTSPATPVTP